MASCHVMFQSVGGMFFGVTTIEERSAEKDDRKNWRLQFPQGVITLTMIELHLCLHY